MKLEELIAKVSLFRMSRSNPILVRHFKNKFYEVLNVAEHTETGEALVIYRAMYGLHKVYARPASMFCSPVDKDKYPDAKQADRFEFVTELQYKMAEAMFQVETIMNDKNIDSVSCAEFIERAAYLCTVGGTTVKDAIDNLTKHSVSRTADGRVSNNG